MKTSIARVSLCLLLPLVTSACGSRPANEDAADLNIVGGSQVLASDLTAARTATVALTSEALFATGKSFCTSTLIGPNLLLTAAHCVTDQTGAVSRDPILAVFELEVGKDISLARRVKAIAVHKGYDPNVVGQKDPSVFPMNDLAVLSLDRPAPAPYEPVAIVDSRTVYPALQQVVLAGFGVTATRTVNTTGKLRAVKATIKNDQNSGNVLLLRGPQLNVKAVDYDAAGNVKIVQGNGGACAGDSGGPAYVRRSDGKWVVVGATSYGSELRIAGRWDFTRYCIGENGYVDLRKYGRGLQHATTALQAPEARESALTTWTFTDLGAERTAVF